MKNFSVVFAPTDFIERARILDDMNSLVKNMNDETYYHGWIEVYPEDCEFEDLLEFCKCDDLYNQAVGLFLRFTLIVYGVYRYSVGLGPLNTKAFVTSLGQTFNNTQNGVAIFIDHTVTMKEWLQLNGFVPYFESKIKKACCYSIASRVFYDMLKDLGIYCDRKTGTVLYEDFEGYYSDNPFAANYIPPVPPQPVQLAV